MLVALSKYEKGFTRFGFRHPCLILPFAKRKILDHEVLSLLFAKSGYNITHILSPTSSNNSLPNEITAILDCRFTVPVKQEDIIKKIERKIKDSDIRVTLINNSPPAKPSIPDQFFYLMEKAILNIQPTAAVIPILFPATVDNNYFRNKGIPVFGLLPCVLNSDDVARIHSTDERILISSLHQGVEIYSSFIELTLQSAKKSPAN
jgi:carboxypeptidase PM20D1